MQTNTSQWSGVSWPVILTTTLRRFTEIFDIELNQVSLYLEIDDCGQIPISRIPIPEGN